MNPLLFPPSRLARSVLHTQSDERLAELAGFGSEAAFETIVARYRRSLVRHCGRVVGESDAEEAVQNALVRAHGALVRGDRVQNLGGWLHAIAYNSALNVLRARAARPELPHPDCCDAADHHDEPLEHRHRFGEVIAAVQSLPARQREAIVMRELEGRSYDEIAQRLDSSEGAVRQLLHRARGALRERMGAFLGAEPILRWLLESGSGPTVARLSALGCGSALTAKLCATALVPSVVAGGAASLPHGHGAAPRTNAIHAAAPRASVARPVASSRLVAAPEVWRITSPPLTRFAKPRLQAAGATTTGAAAGTAASGAQTGAGHAQPSRPLVFESSRAPASMPPGGRPQSQPSQPGSGSSQASPQTSQSQQQPMGGTAPSEDPRSGAGGVREATQHYGGGPDGATGP